MKKLKLLSLAMTGALAVIGLCSCDEEEIPNVEQNDEEKLSLEVKDYKRVFYLNEDFTVGDLKVYCKTSNDESELVTNYEIDASHFNNKKEGYYSIYVTYNGKKCHYRVLVIKDESHIIRFKHPFGNDLDGELNEVITAYENKFPGWEIEVIGMDDYSTLSNELYSDLHSNKQPDLTFSYTDDSYKYVKTGKVVDLSKYFYNSNKLSINVKNENNEYYVKKYSDIIGYDNSELKDFINTYLEGGNATNYFNYESFGYTTDSLVSLPFLQSSDVLYYNKTALDELGLSVPNTWSELWNACHTIADYNIESTPLGFGSESNLLANISKQNGWSYLQKDNPQYLFNNSSVRNYLTELDINFKDYLFTTSLLYSSSISEIFKKGAKKGSIFCIDSSLSAGLYETADFEVGVAKLPGTKQPTGINNSSLTTGLSLIMFHTEKENSTEKELMTWEFMKMLEESSFQSTAALKLGGHPSRKSVCDESSYSEFLKEDSLMSKVAKIEEEQIDNYFINPVFENSDMVAHSISMAFYNSVTRRKTPEKALEDAINSLGGNNFPFSTEEALNNLVLENENTTIKKSFSVPTTFKYKEYVFDISWASKSRYLEAIPNCDVINVIRPEDNKCEAVLTATINILGVEFKKEFTFYVEPISVIDFVENYDFKYAFKVIYDGDELDTKEYIGNKEAKITWTPVDTDLIVVDQNKVCITKNVSPEDVSLMATFSYKGETSTKIYEFTVVPTTSNFEKASYLYDEFDSYTRLDISGYVVSKDVYNDSYGNTTIYIVDDEGICGNMVYHIKCDKETYDALTFGTHITVYNVFNYKYLECLEAVCDNLSYFTIDKNIPIKTADELIMPIDYELISNYSYLHYRPYQLVSLTGWKVKDINKSNEFPYSRGTDLITVVKGGVEISLCVPKWIAVKESNLLTLYNTIEELSIGDIVNIKGILGYENRNHIQKDLNSYKIYVTDGESIVINSSYDSSFDTTNILNANDIKLAINYTHNVMYFNEHNKYEIRFLKDNNTESQKIELVKFVDGVSVEWEISTNERFGAPKAVSLTDKEIVINYTEEPERVVLVATFTKGDITFIQYYFIIINVA